MKSKHTKKDLRCPECGSEVSDIKGKGIFYMCNQGSPSGDARSWGCGWYGSFPINKKNE